MRALQRYFVIPFRQLRGGPRIAIDQFAVSCQKRISSLKYKLCLICY